MGTRAIWRMAVPEFTSTTTSMRRRTSAGVLSTPAAGGRAREEAEGGEAHRDDRGVVEVGRKPESALDERTRAEREAEGHERRGDHRQQQRGPDRRRFAFVVAASMCQRAEAGRRR